MTKQMLRQQMLEKRMALSVLEKSKASKQIIKQITAQDDFKSAHMIGLYMPIKNEVDITMIIDMFPDKKFALPKVVDKELIYVMYQKNELKQSVFGILEPVVNDNIAHKLDLVYVPALAVNARNYRLGYGKGYFDTFFTKYNDMVKVGIIYAFQAEEFQETSNDIALNYYIKAGMTHDY